MVQINERLDVAHLEAKIATESPQDILHLAFSQFDNIAISFSGAEDVVLIDMAHKIKPDVNVFTLDTGRLHQETYRFIDTVRAHYGIAIAVTFPNPDDVSALVSGKGFFSFYENGHQECCGIRKVRPLRQKLSTLEAWITGQRKDQNPSTRADVPVVQLDTTFSTEEQRLIKFNPLANWTSADVWDYIHLHQVPYNALHEQGYISIGCEPCTRSTLPNQHERVGRWWWEDPDDKECGVHATNLKR
jgi:phosphoadenosine phosphosulfate reductase